MVHIVHKGDAGGGADRQQIGRRIDPVIVFQDETGTNGVRQMFQGGGQPLQSRRFVAVGPAPVEGDDVGTDELGHFGMIEQLIQRAPGDIRRPARRAA
jgi:hypothetical protein